VNEQKVTGYFRVSQARDDMHAPEIYGSEIARYCRYGPRSRCIEKRDQIRSSLGCVSLLFNSACDEA
jgi:hypothetical protein